MLAVLKRELRNYFSSLTGYIFMAFFLFFTGLFFVMYNLQSASPQYTTVLGNITFIFLIVVPILTMRLLSEETRQKTDQLLLTSPLSLSGMVLGKYFAAVGVFLATLVITMFYPVILSTMGTITVPEITGGYIGFFLLGAAFISVGLFISSLTENQVISAVVTFGALMLMWIIDAVIQGLPVERNAGLAFAGIVVLAVGAFVYFTTKNLYVSIGVLIVGTIVFGAIFFINPGFYNGFIARFFAWFSLTKRYQDFSMGVFGISPIIYYITFISAFLFMTVRVLEKRRWS